MDRYTVLVRIWHSGDERYYDVGASVTMTHLVGFQIDRLIAQGIIEPVKSKRKKREVKQHGDIDGTEH